MWQVLKPDKADIAFVVLFSCVVGLSGGLIAGLIMPFCFAYVHCASAGLKIIVRMLKIQGTWYAGVAKRKHWLLKRSYWLWKSAQLVGMIVLCTIVWPYTFAVARSNPDINIYRKAS